jgi:hypothetical protein
VNKTPVVVVVLALASTASADRVIRVATLPAKVDRAAVDAALDGAFRHMTPCFRKGGGTVEVKLEVGADGEVTKATAVGKGGAAQCAAGLLAVTAFPAGPAWKGTVAVDALGAEQWLNAQLAKKQGELGACQAKDPASKGDVALALVIAKTGVVTGATVAQATASKAIADCARTAALAIRLDPLPGGADVKYRLQVSYGGGGSGGGTGAGAGGGTVAGGSSGGALASAVVQEHWAAQRAKLFACGAKLGKAATVTVSFRIRADGTVKNVVLKDSTIGAKAVEECVDKELRALKFPTASGETQVSLPVAWTAK